MKRSTTGLVLGSALVVGLSGCASSASQSSSAEKPWYSQPFVCGLAGGLNVNLLDDARGGGNAACGDGGAGAGEALGAPVNIFLGLLVVQCDSFLRLLLR